MISQHYINKRFQRNELISKIGIGKPIESFAVDKGHKDGSEIHIITSTGLIVIYNRNSHKLCTVLIARPNQIKRYYVDLGRNDFPNSVLELAYKHMKMGYNKI